MRPLGRPSSRWVNNIRMDLGEVGWGDVDWIGLAQDRDMLEPTKYTMHSHTIPILHIYCYQNPKPTFVLDRLTDC
jgi:hypothetical protein